MLTKGKRMPTIQQLREQRANVWEQMKEVMDRADREGRDMSAEESAIYDRAETDLDRIDDTIQKREKFEARAEAYSQVETPGAAAAMALGDEGADDGYARAFTSYLRGGLLDMSAEDRKVLQSGFVAGEQFKMAQGVGTNSAGGYAVAPEFRDKLVETMKYFGPMLNKAELITTDTGANLQWPTNDDTSNVGAILAENTQASSQDLTLGTASLDAYMYTSKLVLVSFQLLQDSAFDFEAYLTRKLGERLGRIINQHATTGTGSSQPDGIMLPAATITGTGSLASTGGVSYDNLVDLLESVDPAYAGLNDLGWMMHQTARKAIRKLKDSQNRPLWEPSVKAGVADTLLGYPMELNNDMATVAQNAKSIGFGSIRSAYVIRLVTNVATLRLTERYADYLQVGFLAFQRADATLQDANAWKIFQVTATA